MAGALPRRLAAAVWLLAVVVAASSGGSDDPAADDGGGEVVLMLEEEEGVAYARVLRPEGSAGWMELWQEGHRLMANTTELELSIGTRGVDTYLWASLFDADGRWIAQSNVLHTGHHAGVGVSIAASVWERRWEEGEQLQVTFSLPLAPSFEEYKVDAAIFLIDNQTVGMMHLGATVARNDGPLQEWTYVHHGQVEVGEHTLSLAILKPGASSPVAFSPQGWFSVAAASLETRVYTHAWLLPEDAAHLPECSMAFRACFAASAGRVPPNRQYTELLDAAEGCASKLCPGDLDQETVLALARAPLLGLIDHAFSSIALPRQVEASFLRAGQVFQCLGERDLAIRCFRAALRHVGRAEATLTRQQCTYPGCNDMAKDACNLLHRALLQELHPGRVRLGIQGHARLRTGDTGYAEHLRHIIPQPDPTGGAGGTGKGGRYGVGDVVFGCLTTAGSYRTRARAVKETWRKHTELFHLYGDAPDESLPITPYAALEGGGLSEEQEFLKEQIEAADYASSLAKFFCALRDMHTRHPEASWYYLGGDDNFVVPENLVAQLQGLDAASVLMVGGPLGSHVGVGKYPSGGSGIIFSNGFLRASSRHLAPFAASWRRERGKAMLCHPCADIAFGVLARDVAAEIVEVQCMHGMWPEYFALHTSPSLPACAPRASTRAWPRITCARPASFHYVQPRAMRLLAAALLPEIP